MVRGKKFLSNILKLCGRDGLNMLKQMGDVTFLTIVQEMLGKVKGKLLSVVTGNGELTFQLTFGCRKLTVRERMLHHAV